MIEIRHQAGINSESDVEVTQRSTYYESVSKGTKGTLICRVGSAAPSAAPTGYTLVAAGNGWRYFLDDECAGVDAIESDETDATIGATDGGVYVTNPKGEQVNIYTTDGKLMHSSAAIECDVKLASGIYLVKVGALTEKVLVK